MPPRSGLTTQPRRGRATPRSRNPRGEGERLRAELVDAAVELLDELGDANLLSLRQVALRVGVAAPSVYLHFADRGQLVEAATLSGFAALEERIVAAVGGRTGGAALRAGCEGYLAFALERPGLYRVLFGGWPRAQRARRLDPAQLGALTGLASLIEARDAGVEPLHAAANLWCALHGVAMLRNTRPEVPWPPLEVQLDELIAALAG